MKQRWAKGLTAAVLLVGCGSSGGAVPGGPDGGGDARTSDVAADAPVAGDTGVDAQPEAGACTPGAMRCSGSGVETCGSSGQWGAAVACAANQTCSGGQCGTSAGPKVALFGGNGESGGYFQDTWTFDGMSWTQVNTISAPLARGYAGAATLGNELVLFSGSESGSIPPQDTWTFNGTSWTQVCATCGPPALQVPTMATLGNEVVLFGGVAGAVYSQDTWTFSGTSWTQVSAASSPPARGFATMATLGTDVVLFGGQAGQSAAVPLLQDTWMFDGTSWTQVSAANSPPARSGAMMATLREPGRPLRRR
jgi:N-acetylneuraminic acid mutarotase